MVAAVFVDVPVPFLLVTGPEAVRFDGRKCGPAPGSSGAADLGRGRACYPACPLLPPPDVFAAAEEALLAALGCLLSVPFAVSCIPCGLLHALKRGRSRFSGGSCRGRTGLRVPSPRLPAGGAHLGQLGSLGLSVGLDLGRAALVGFVGGPFGCRVLATQADVEAAIACSQETQGQILAIARRAPLKQKQYGHGHGTRTRIVSARALRNELGRDTQRVSKKNNN